MKGEGRKSYHKLYIYTPPLSFHSSTSTVEILLLFVVTGYAYTYTHLHIHSLNFLHPYKY